MTGKKDEQNRILRKILLKQRHIGIIIDVSLFCEEIMPEPYMSTL